MAGLLGSPFCRAGAAGLRSGEGRRLHLDKPFCSWQEHAHYVPVRNMSADQDARTQWLFAQWAQIDAWIKRHRAARSA
jgi:hypothetical protein